MLTILILESDMEEEKIDLEKDLEKLYNYVDKELSKLSRLPSEEIKFVYQEVFEEITNNILSSIIYHIPFKIYGRNLEKVRQIIYNDKLLSNVVSCNDELKYYVSKCGNNFQDQRFVSIITRIEEDIFKRKILYVDEVRINNLLESDSSNYLDKSKKEYLMTTIKNYNFIRRKRKSLLENKLNLSDRGRKEYVSYIKRHERNLERLLSNNPFEILSTLSKKDGNVKLLQTSKNLSTIYNYVPNILSRKIITTASSYLINSYLPFQLFKVDNYAQVFNSFEDLMSIAERVRK